MDVVLVGDRHDSAKYVAYKELACEEVGIATHTHALGSDVSEAEVVTLVQRLASDERVNAILVQLPLPHGINVRRVLDAVPAHKDVDGLCSDNEVALFQGRRPRFVPCTALVRCVVACCLGATTPACATAMLPHSRHRCNMWCARLWRGWGGA